MTNMTYAEALNIAIATIDNTEAKDKLTALKATLEKRHSGPSKKKVEEMNGRIDAVYSALLAFDEPVTVTDLIKGATNEVAGYSNQRVSALLSKLCKDGKAVKTIEKRKSFYAIAD